MHPTKHWGQTMLRFIRHNSLVTHYRWGIAYYEVTIWSSQTRTSNLFVKKWKIQFFHGLTSLKGEQDKTLRIEVSWVVRDLFLLIERRSFRKMNFMLESKKYNWIIRKVEGWLGLRLDISQNPLPLVGKGKLCVSKFTIDFKQFWINFDTYCHAY